MSVLALGNVVRWTRGKGTGLGVVESVTGSQVTVRLDDPEDGRKTFRWPTDVLQRVVYEPGKFVQGVGDGITGMVTSHSVHEQLAIYQVSQPDGTMRTVLETGLRPAHLTDPAALIASGEIHDGRSTNLRIAATRLLFAQQYEELSALSNSRVEIKPHQVAVLHRAATTYPHRFLLADEVGLGKTIEAGLIIKELKARGVADRVLILAPSGIVSQWQYELKSKFNEAFSRYTRETIKYLEGKHPGENVWTLEPNVITSTTYASWDEARRKDITLAGWDLVVIDEAHHVRRTYEGQNKHSETQLYKLGAALAEAGESRAGAMLLLTATPMQLHPFELYSLIELLDPTLFPDYGEFDAHRRELAGLNRALDRALEWPRLDRRAQEEVSEEVARWLATAPERAAELLATAQGRETAADGLREKHRVSEVMIRNRKAIVGGFKGRLPHVIPVRMTEAERTAYTEVSAYAQHGYRRSKETGNQALGFLMAVFQKLNASSSHALRRSLLRRIERLEEERTVREPELPDEEEQSEAVLGEGADWIALEADVERIEELLELKRLVGLLNSIDVDSKAHALRQ
jgi:ATP-dependent helicase HepA